MMADNLRWLPLHFAARDGHVAAVELLLAAAVGATSATAVVGYLSLHLAAINGHTAVVELLLAALSETERAKTADDCSALYLAARYSHLPAAHVLLERSTAAPAELIADLLAAIPAIHGLEPAPKALDVVHVLLADLAASRELLPADWALLPTPFPRLAHGLPAVLARSTEEAAQLVTHLSAAARGRLRALALSLARLQRRLRLELPESIVRRILLLAPLEEETACLILRTGKTVLGQHCQIIAGMVAEARLSGSMFAADQGPVRLEAPLAGLTLAQVDRFLCAAYDTAVGERMVAALDTPKDFGQLLDIVECFDHGPLHQAIHRKLEGYPSSPLRSTAASANAIIAWLMSQAMVDQPGAELLDAHSGLRLFTKMSWRALDEACPGVGLVVLKGVLKSVHATVRKGCFREVEVEEETEVESDDVDDSSDNAANKLSADVFRCHLPTESDIARWKTPH
eukprot:scaffold8.g1728.t1